MSTAGRAHSPHGCPHCRCDWTETDDTGIVNTSAPFYGLVEAILAIDDKDPRGRKGGAPQRSRAAWRDATPQDHRRDARGRWIRTVETPHQPPMEVPA